MKTLLAAIGSTEESSFGEMCNALGDDCPDKGDKTAWHTLFNMINIAEEEELVEVHRNGTKIDGLILTEAGITELKNG